MHGPGWLEESVVRGLLVFLVVIFLVLTAAWVLT